MHFSLTCQGSNLELEEALLERLMEFPLINFHYYCETTDLTSPFPSSSTTHTKGFCWNDWLAKPFTQIGMRICVPHLVAGIAREKEVEIKCVLPFPASQLLLFPTEGHLD